MAPVNRFRQAYHLLLYLLAFSFPYLFITSATGVVLLGISWLTVAKVKETAASFRRSPQVWCWLIYFGLHALSYCYSTNKEQSLFDIQTKLSFVVLPLAIGLGPKLTAGVISRILFSFTAGITVAALISLAHAGIIWAHTGSTSQFFYHDLVNTGIMSPNAVYFAWYTFFSLAILLFAGWPFPGRLSWLRVGCIAVQLIFFILLSSRLMLVLMLVTVVPLYLRQFMSVKHLQGRLRLGILALLIGIGALLFAPNPVRTRFLEIIHPQEQPVYTADTHKRVLHFSNLTLRFFLWGMAWDNIKEHRLWPAGCGNGDVGILQQEQVERWQRRGYDFTYNPNLGQYDLHNMYLQSLMMLGIPGLMLFLLLLFLPFPALRGDDNRIIFGLFFLSSALFMLQEAAFQTQAGIIYFTCFSQIFWNCRRREPDHVI